LWLSDDPAPVGLWTRLRVQHPKSGLWPLLLAGLDSDPARPWAEGELHPEETYLPEQEELLDPANILSRMWTEVVEEANRDLLKALAPFGAQWPGLAAAGVPHRDPDSHADSCADMLPGEDRNHVWRLGLVAAPRGADALANVGWEGPLNHGDTGELAVVVRSWEERFGVRVIGVGFADLMLSVAAPPDSGDHALRVAAEHFAFCPDSIMQGISPMRAYASSIYGASTWSFWWD